MNNTVEDFKPLILTAFHCAYDRDQLVDEKDMEQWSFYFHHEREGCDETSIQTVRKTMTGCKMLVNTGLENGSDGMLLELNQMIPESYDVFYNGWDRRNTPALSGVCIHHPQGDYKKISTYSTPAKETTFNSNEFTGSRSAHWNVIFRQTANGHGVTEGGSSGSPLYNENKLVVGTLTGGSSSCSLPEGLNLYGKMSYHWDHYKAASTRMDSWLDPTNSGVETLAGRFYHKVSKPVPINLTVENQGYSILLRWNAPQSTETPLYYNIYRHNQKIGQATGFSFMDPNPVNGPLIYSVSAVYTGELESSFVSATLLYVEFKAPSDLRAERIMDTGNEVTLSWHAPAYEQTIYWGTMEPVWIVGFDNLTSFYYGQKWSSEEINPLHEKTIKAIRFAPMENNIYEIYISQGDCVYRQPIESSSLNYADINTIGLNEPFTIDGSKSLIVAIYISYAGSKYPAVGDNGPAVNGKGNICSVDGENWETLYDEKEPDDFNYNFIVSVIVSSERGSSVYKSESDHKETLKYSSRVPVKTKFVTPYATTRAVSDASALSYNAVPTAFPEITRYLIYRSSSVFKNVDDPSATHYTDKNPYLSISSYYEISAFYGEFESEKSDKAYITTANNTENTEGIADIYPTRFSGSVNLNGFDAVTRVDIVSVSGKVCLAVNHPDRTIDTSSLAPGLYFFRIYGPNNQILKVVRAVKISG
jgi:hypothetical protein